jgi:AcrR family transcriptional regulator
MARRTNVRAKRAPLSRERVLHAAITLADKEGIAAVSMRKLAQELGVEAMSLYNHVANKDEVLDGMVDAVASEIALPSPEADWKTAIRTIATSAHETLLRHPWAGNLWIRQMPGAARLRHFDAVLRSLREAGFSKDLTYHGYHILQSYVLGYTLQVLTYRTTLAMEELADTAATFLQELPVDEFPDFAEHVRQHMEPRSEDVSAFELGLDLLLDGLERQATTL